MTYVLGFVLSLLIPHPFPRALLMMSLVAAVIQKARMNKADAASLGLSVFVATTATSTILLTGDSTLNIATVGFSGLSVGWLDWLKYMAIPGLIATVLMLTLHLLVFKQTGPVTIDRAALRLEQQKLGPMTRREVVTLVWVLVALLLWVTDFIHHIDPAWVALGAAVGLSLPIVGDVLDAKDISTGINWPIVLFVVGALAIGTVGKVTGLSDWLAASLLPTTPPQNPYAFAALVGGATMLIHMVLGSALACMSIVAPPMVQYAAAAGVSPIGPCLDRLHSGRHSLPLPLPARHDPAGPGGDRRLRHPPRAALRSAIDFVGSICHRRRRGDLVANCWFDLMSVQLKGENMFHRPSPTSLASAVIVLLMLLMALGLSGCTPVTQPAPAEISSPAAPAPAETSNAAAMPTETSSAAAMPAETQPPAEASGAAAPPPPQGNVMPAGGPGGASTFASVDPSFIDLAYADQSEAQKLDLYLPTTGDGPFPVVVMVHGGGFMFGDKADGAGLTGVDQLLEAGYAVASINYRLSGEATCPAQINDFQGRGALPARQRCPV